MQYTNMLSTAIPCIGLHDCALKTCAKIIFVLTLGLAPLFITPASATAFGSSRSLISLLKANSDIKNVVVVRRGTTVRRTTVVGPRGNAASRTVVRRGAVVRPGYAGGGVRWARPGWYRWAPGGAIAAGAALGFIAAGTAVAWAGSPPAPGYCWYYTDPSQRQGFWDVCPQ